MLTIKGDRNHWLLHLHRLVHNETQIVDSIGAVVHYPATAVNEDTHGKARIFRVSRRTHNIDSEAILGKCEWPSRTVLYNVLVREHCQHMKATYAISNTRVSIIYSFLGAKCGV